MLATPSRSDSSPPGFPRLTFVTGPDVADVARWLDAATAAGATARCAILVCSLAAPRVRRVRGGAGSEPAEELRPLVLPCLCCPSLANFPQQIRDAARETGAEHLFVALPVLAAAGLVAEFDVWAHAPREFVVHLDAAWSAARRADALSFFQFSLLAAADRVVDPSARRPVSLCA